jgi:threonine dehydrogenase-like Zn-dependent dehydrogenase
VTHACGCGSDLHPYLDLEDTPKGRRMGHEAIGVVEQVGEQPLSDIAEAYRLMDSREALKVLIRP